MYSITYVDVIVRYLFLLELRSLLDNPVADDPVQEHLGRILLPVVCWNAFTVKFLVSFRSSKLAFEGQLTGTLFLLKLNISQISLLASHVPSVLLSEVCRVANTLGKRVHFIRSYIVGKVVVLHVVNGKVPVSSVVLVSCSDVHSVHLVVERDQMLCVYFHIAISGVLVVAGGYAGSNLSNMDVLVRIGYGVGNFIVLVVGMAPHLKAYDVLVALHEGSETTSRLMLEGSRVDVADKVSDAASLLNVLEFIFEPLHMVAGV